MKFGCSDQWNRGVQQEISVSTKVKKNCTISTEVPNLGV